MPVCPKCKAEYVEGILNCSDCHIPLVDDADAKAASALVSLIAAEAPLAERIVEFLSYSGVEVQMRFDQEADLFDLTVPEEQYEESIRLMKVLLANEALHSMEAEAQRAQRFPAEPFKVHVRASDQYSDVASSAFSFLLVGAAVTTAMLLIATGVIHPPLYGQARFLTYTVLTVLGLVFLAVGVTSARKARQIKAAIREEDQFNASVYQWFLSTYTGAQIDQSADAQMDQDVAMNPEKQFTIISDEIRCLKRMDVIREYLKREYQHLDDGYVEYLCEELYQKIYENKAAAN